MGCCRWRKSVNPTDEIDLKLFDREAIVLRVNYEEKTYESYFNTELGQRTRVYFPLGQVQEGNLGFDSAAHSLNKSLWSLLGYPFRTSPTFNGSTMQDIADEMETFLGKELGSMPTMKVNILFQYKKPDYITTAHGREWADRREPYYRYDIYEEQQKLLMNIHRCLGHRVLAIYASPALRDVDDMVKAYLKRKIIQSSNFVAVDRLDSHHRNNYTCAGRHSRAYSEPEEIHNLDLIELLDGFQNAESPVQPRSNSELIIRFARDVASAVSETPDWSSPFERLNRLFADYRQYELVFSLLTMRNFGQLTGIQWVTSLMRK